MGGAEREKETEQRLQQKEQRTAKDAFNNAEEEQNTAIVRDTRETKTRGFKLKCFDKSEPVKS